MIIVHEERNFIMLLPPFFQILCTLVKLAAKLRRCINHANIKMDSQHFRFLENMYLQAPIVKAVYPGSAIRISRGTAVIECPAEPHYFHAADSLHGSVYFRMLDDAAYFAASSLEKTYFLLTAEFTIKFLRPVSGGLLKAEGRITDSDAAGRYIHAEALLYTSEGKIAAKGSGRFTRSHRLLSTLGTETPG